VSLDSEKLSDLKDRVIDAVRRCYPGRNGQILIARLGLTDGPTPTLLELGERYGITRERVRQIEKNGLRKLNADEFADIFVDHFGERP